MTFPASTFIESIEMKVLGGFPVIATAKYTSDEDGDYIEDMRLYTTKNKRAYFIEEKLSDEEWDKVASEIYEYVNQPQIYDEFGGCL